MNILAIETSCDETAAAVVEDGRHVKSNVIHTQIDIHTRYGGVVPEIASRNHVMDLPFVIDRALEDAGLTLKDIDAVAVTKGPGLVGALLVGVSHAKAMAAALGVPLIGVHHIEGHIAANYIQYPELEPPFLCLVISGGHTHLVHVKSYTDYEILGRTRDDAAGEAFDKVARVIGLGYPGGPKIDRAATRGNPDAYDFPRVTLEKDSLDFSFSGLKSAVINTLHTKEQRGEAVVPEDVAASFQHAVTDVLVDKTMAAAEKTGLKKIALAGGVSANTHIRKALGAACAARGYDLYVPDTALCTDNAAMIGAAGYYDARAGRTSGLRLDAVPGLKLGAD